MRCELRVWHTGTVFDYVMFSASTNEDFLAAGLESSTVENGDDDDQQKTGLAAAEGSNTLQGKTRAANKKRSRQQRQKGDSGGPPTRVMFKANDFSVVTELAGSILSYFRDKCLAGEFPELSRRYVSLVYHQIARVRWVVRIRTPTADLPATMSPCCHPCHHRRGHPNVRCLWCS